MLAVLIGSLALLAGLLLMLLPLLAPELTRARDGLWAAVVLLLALVLVTSADRLTGAPMLGVLCGGLLIGRLGTEVGQQRWSNLAEEQRSRLQQRDHWLAQLQLLLEAGSKLVAAVLSLLGWLRERLRKPQINKRWVREQPTDATAQPNAAPTASASPATVEESAAAAEPTAATEPAQDQEQPQEQELEPATASEPTEMAASREGEPEAVAAAEPEPEPAAELDPEPAATQAEEPEAEVEPEPEPEPQNQASSEPEQTEATPEAEQELPLLDAEILDPTPQPQRNSDEPTLTVISSLNDVDALLEDGRSG